MQFDTAIGKGENLEKLVQKKMNGFAVLITGKLPVIIITNILIIILIIIIIIIIILITIIIIIIIIPFSKNSSSEKTSLKAVRKNNSIVT